MTPTRELLEAALQGYDIQRKAIEAKQAEIREALKSPVDEMNGIWQKKIATLLDPGDLSGVIDVTTHDFGGTPQKPKRKMSAAGRAAISAATKKRWAKFRKEQKRA